MRKVPSTSKMKGSQESQANIANEAKEARCEEGILTGNEKS